MRANRMPRGARAIRTAVLCPLSAVRCPLAPSTTIIATGLANSWQTSARESRFVHHDVPVAAGSRPSSARGRWISQGLCAWTPLEAQAHTKHSTDAVTSLASYNSKPADQPAATLPSVSSHDRRRGSAWPDPQDSYGPP